MARWTGSAATTRRDLYLREARAYQPNSMPTAAALEADDFLDDAAFDEDECRIAVVKMKLASFCPDPRIRAKLQAVVMDCNVLMGEAYAFANLHVTRLLTQGAPAPKIDRSFYYRCLLAVAAPNPKMRSGTLGAEFQTTLDAFDALRPAGQAKIDATAYNQVMADLSISMATAATNHLWMNVERRLARYVSSSHPDLGRAKMGLVQRVVTAVIRAPKAVVSDVFRSLVASDNERRRAALSKAIDLASRLRELTPLPSALQAASRAHLLLPLYHRILSDTNAGSTSGPTPPKRKAALKAFTLLPVKHNYTVSHVPVSSMMLMRMLRDLKLEAFTGDGRDQDHLALWRKHFHTSAVETQRRKFAKRIVTDGCAVSVVLEGSSTGREPQNAGALLDGVTRVVGVDPGVTDVVTTASLTLPQLPTSEELAALCANPAPLLNGASVQHYSSARYYHAAKYFTSARRVARWNNETAERTSAVPSGRVADMAALSEHTRAYLDALRPVLQHRATRGYRNMRFLRYCHKRRAVEEICRMIAPRGQKTLVGFGDWEGVSKTPISRRTCGPPQDVRKQLAKSPDAVFVAIDEFRTSATCCRTHQPLVNMKANSTRLARDDAGSVVKQVVRTRVHKTLHCPTSKNSGDRLRVARSGVVATTCNRDVNAAKNMLLLVLCQANGVARPQAFRRGARKSNAAARA